MHKEVAPSEGDITQMPQWLDTDFTALQGEEATSPWSGNTQDLSGITEHSETPHPAYLPLDKMKCCPLCVIHQSQAP